MSSHFATQKTELLRLTAPDALNNISPIDVGIRKLVDEINEIETLVTTNSCAGRIVVYLEGRSSTSPRSNLEDHARISGASIAADDNNGQSLFVAHDPLPLSGKSLVAPMLGLADHTNLGVPPSIEGVRWVRCKFEPMCLRILCASLESAQKLDTAALQSGFRESGISSISTDNLRASTAMVAIRNTDLAFDSVIGYEADDGKLIPMVTEAYMRVLVELCNEKFKVNKQKTEAFREALFTSFKPH
ncbi:uncharacterized protein M437DRAFT_41233 [Aureobasidium melanogenum CBS 110374]|uniref:tRNA(Phe) 7-[(3-amino-3-carboxypropyl)-4-demethylwyosine(37)-N(4)]-methyltransferase n=1 Tax=Aureobasidium melanogenum (strain CBS 110374) TaxID=1043003 RepID=A0A074VXX1_AURM1|nr:uncharacterized protein M437DRAFT_41233 [Aureobasidium melanogenum CBS 110374]KEQ65615.1 hypothetical protein M437DRAFT_41233 [Aureobasidium melanogenum CBS 110374]